MTVARFTTRARGNGGDMAAPDDQERHTTDDADEGIGQRAREAGVVDQQAVLKDQLEESDGEKTG